MRSLVIASTGKERRRTSLSGEMVEEEMEKGWGSLARGGRKASLPVLTSYKRLPVMDTMDSMDTVDSRIHEGASSRESSVSRSKRREASGLRERKSTPSRPPWRSPLHHSLSLASLLKTPRPRLSAHMISLPYYSPASPSYEGRTRALSTNLDFSPLSLDASPIYQNVIPFNVAEEIARFEKDYVQPLTERGTEGEGEEGIYEEVKVDEERTSSCHSSSSSSSSLSSDSGAFSRLSTPDLSVKSGEIEKCSSSSGLSTSSSSSGLSSSSSSSSCQHLPLSPLSSLSLEDSTHVSAECNSQVTVNGRCYNCR